MKLKKTIGGIFVFLVAVIVAAGVYLYYAVDRNEIRRIVEQKAEEATGRKLVMAGPIDLGISLSPSVSVADVSFANADWGSRPEMAKIGSFEVQLALLPLISGNVEVQRVVLSGADILLETDKEGRANWEFKTAAEPGAAAGQQPSGTGEPPSASERRIEVASLRVLDSRLLYRDGKTGESLAFAVGRLEATSKPDAIGIDFEGSYQDAPIQLSGELGSLSTLLAGGDYPIEIAGSLNGAKLVAEGRIREIKKEPKPDLRLEVSGKSFALFSPFAGAPIPPIGPFVLSGQLSGGGKSFGLVGLSATVANSDLAGDVTLSLAGKRPFIKANLTSAVLNLEDFAAGAETEAGGESKPAAQGSASPYVVPDEPLPLEGLKAADAEVEAKIGTLRLDKKLEVSNLATHLKLDGGRLEMDRLAARIFEGALDGRLTLDAGKDTPQLATAMNLKGLDYGNLLRSFEVSDRVQGKVDVSLDLKGAGKTPHAIAGSLNGRSEVVAGEGIITDKLLAIVASGLDQVLGPLLGGQKDTRLNCFVTRFAHEKGVMRSQALLLDSSTFAVAGAGTLDMKTEALDFRFDTATRQAALASLAVPFDVAGTLKNPKVKPDALAAASKASKALGKQSGTLGQLQGLMGQQGQETTIVDNPCQAALAGKPVTAQQPSGGTAQQPAATPTAPQEQQVEEGLKQLEEDAGKAGQGVKDAIKGLFKK